VEAATHAAKPHKLLENYTQIVEEVNPKAGRKKRKQIFPRYHQLDVVRKLLTDAAANGAGTLYLIEHSGRLGQVEDRRLDSC
jgi:type I restriction enzyme, R subunit